MTSDEYKLRIKAALGEFGEKARAGKARPPRFKKIKDPDAEPTEHEEQVAVRKWLEANGAVVFATANGAMLHGNEHERIMRWKKLEASGVSAGVPDMVVCSKARNGSITFIEMKRAKAIDLTNHGCGDKQLRWHARLRDCGHNVIVGCGADHAIDQLIVLGYGRG